MDKSQQLTVEPSTTTHIDPAKLSTTNTTASATTTNLNNNGPRVSFNRDVHVKRIGTRPNEILPPNFILSPSPAHTVPHSVAPTNNNQSILRRELPEDLSEEGILKEAARVIAQADRVKCTADGGNLSEKNRGRIEKRKDDKSEDRFHSLPSRKKASKPVSRSASDASTKKSKKPSIFSIFNRKSDPDQSSGSASTTPDKQLESHGGNGSKRVSRSKSDVGSSSRPSDTSKDSKSVRKRNNSENEEIGSVKKKAQLSPIIENSLDYFNVKTDDKIKTLPPSGITISTKPSTTSTNIAVFPSLDFVPSDKPIADSIKETINSFSKHSKSLEDMHSSQQPTQRPPLTKGLTVDGMVKRLSEERFSPPPHLAGPAFSYTRPNEQIIYAQVVCDNDGKLKQTVHSSYNSTPPRDTISPTPPTMASTTIKIGPTSSRITSDDQTDYIIHKSNIIPSHNGYDPKGRTYSPAPPVVNGTKHIGRNYSPKYSDEDEGLGFEIKRQFDDPTYSPTRYISEELPIVPIIRDISPVRIRIEPTQPVYRNHEVHRSKPFPEINNLSTRRQILESKIHSRKSGSREQLDDEKPIQAYRHDSPNRFTGQSNGLHEHDPTKRYHKLGSEEVLNKYSPERSHLDMISPSRDQRDNSRISKYVQETKYYHDGTDGGFKETYRKETKIGTDGKAHTKETRYRERLDSPKRREIDLGYIDDHPRDFVLGQQSRTPYLEPDTTHFQQKYRPDQFEPKSFDSQFSDVNRSSPEPVLNSRYPSSANSAGRYNYKQFPEKYQAGKEFPTLSRDKRNQRSFDKGDSGIENDYRKDSFNNGDFLIKTKRRTVEDDIKATEMFIKRERQHTEALHPTKTKYNFRFRERSIDDGSHFDPRLDKYPDQKVRGKSEHQKKDVTMNGDKMGATKSEKKLGGLEKMKQLFTGSSKKKAEQNKYKRDPSSSPTTTVSDPQKFIGNNSTMVREDEMRSRYKEYKGSSTDLREPKIADIATRRRLSTPKASPIPKRTPSQKSSRSSSTDAPAQKMGWFKSLDRLSRKKQSTPKIDTTTEEEISTIRPSVRKLHPAQIRKQQQMAQPQSTAAPQKSLRFFGDTDQESNASVSKARSRSTLTRAQKYSQSAYDLDSIAKTKGQTGRTVPATKHRSTSLEHLEKAKHFNGRRSRDLHDISESGSETENGPRPLTKPSRPRHSPERYPLSSSSTNIRNGHRSYGDDEDERDGTTFHDKRYYFESRSRENSHERSPVTVRPVKDVSYERQTVQDVRKPPPGPQKPARAIDRRRAFSRERDRVHDSSGTEGDSSQQSQRSVVYLHATTVGAIPQPYVLGSRRAISREELSSVKSKERTGLQPMTRTVSRSVSVLAPWRPKHLHEGYEINYSQQNNDKKKSTTMARKSTGSASLAKIKKNPEPKSTTTARTNRKQLNGREDLSSMRNSSITSASTMPRGPVNGHRESDVPLRYRTAREPIAIPANGTARRRWNE